MWSCLVKDCHQCCCVREQKSQVILNLIAPNKTLTWPWIWSLRAAAVRAHGGPSRGRFWVGGRSCSFSPTSGEKSRLHSCTWPSRARSSPFAGWQNSSGHMLCCKQKASSPIGIPTAAPVLCLERKIFWHGPKPGQGKCEQLESTAHALEPHSCHVQV